MINTEYNNAQFENNYPDGMENYYWTLARNKILYNEIKRNKLANNLILEIGCARGLVLDYLRKKGLNAWGSELGNPKKIETVKEFIFENQDCKLLPTEFRVCIQTILILDVIEHIQNPTEFLSEIVEKYPNVNSIILTVPARKELWSSYDIKYGHFRRYDLNLIIKTTENLPFMIISNKYFFKMLYIPGLILAKVWGVRNQNIYPPKSKLKILIHNIISKILYLEYLIFPRNIYGSSILCVLKK